MAKKKKTPGVWSEFKAFISRGNIVDMAVGVIIGGAFSAIVTALTQKILTPVINWIIYSCTGGNGIALITVLNGEDYLITDADGVSSINPKCIFIDWGAFINAIINFLLIAIVLFIIIKVIAGVKKKNEALKAKAQEEYYKKHPEERPVPAAPAPKGPTTEELLASILAELQKTNAAKGE